jgi:pre-mRNA-splicing factor CWC22
VFKAHEVVALEILTLLLENATNDSVEVAVAFLKECGSKLDELSRRGVTGIYLTFLTIWSQVLNNPKLKSITGISNKTNVYFLKAIFERLRNILHEGSLDKRVQYMIEVMFAIRKDKFKDHPAIIPELDLIEETEQFTHLMTLDEPADSEDKINVFSFDPNFQDNEEKYKAIKKEILDDESTDDEEDGDKDSDADSDDDEEEEADEDAVDSTTIVDNTETNLISLRRTIYLTIQSSLDFEECAHKLLKLELKPGQIVELCHMIVDCCAQQRTYMKFYGLLAQRFCSLNTEYSEPFTEIFKSCYDTIHRFETNKLRNVSKLFAHLLVTDAISWAVLSHIKLNEEDTTSSSRVFIKILFQVLAESMGLVKLNLRIKDTTLQEAFDGLFPRDNPQNTRFAINFFTSIGLGGLTDDLREHLKAMPKTIMPLISNELNANSSKKRNKSSIKSESESESSSSSSSDEESSSSSSSKASSSQSHNSSNSSSSTYKLPSKRSHRSHHSHSRKDKRERSRRHEPKKRRHQREEEKISRRYHHNNR